MSTQEFKRRLTAILSADVEGYSRLMREDEEATVRTITSYRTAMTHLIEQYRGRVVDSPGDNILAEFPSVLDAVNCAVEIQRDLAERNTALPEDRRMRFRIGVNLGDIVEDGERIYGDGVNIAARMESLAEGGGTCISGTVYDQVKHKLGLEYEFQGEQEVKNIPEPVRVYKILSFPAAAAHRVVKAKKAAGRTWRNAMMVIAVVLIAGAAVAVWNFYGRTPKIDPASKEKMAFPLPDKPSIAVLPFVNMSEDKSHDFFSDGLTEEIITALSRTPQLFVIASNTSFTYKGKPVKVKQVSEELGVRYVLEGSVRKAGDRIRITAQLIDATKDHHLWGERYDRELKDLFAVQDDITKNIVTAVHVNLTEGERSRVFAKGTSNLQAYLKTSEAQWHLAQFTKEGVLGGQRLAEEAIALDPNYAYAHMTLGSAHGYSIFLQMTPSPADSMKRCIESMQKAVALDEGSGEAHATLSYWLVMARQYDRSLEECERAMALSPHSDRVLHACAGTLTFLGKREAAIPMFREALRINPKPPAMYYRHFAVALRDSGRYDESIDLMKRLIEKNPNDSTAYIILASSLGLAGREEEARAAAKEVLRINPAFSLERFTKTSPHKDRAVVERFIEALRRAGLT
jgi:TolB-like protein/class 3 adenylate cyclase